MKGIPKIEKILEEHICDYGCGSFAKYKFSNGKYCCSKTWQSCKKSIDRWTGTSSPRFGKKHSNATKRKMSKSQVGIEPWNKGKTDVVSDELKDILSVQMKERWKDPNNIFNSELYKEKQRIKSTGRIHSEKTKDKIGIGNKGKKMPDEFKRKQSVRMIGNSYGKFLRSDETKRKISKSGIFSINKIKRKYPLFSKIEKMRYNPDKLGEKEIQVHCKNHNCENSKEQGGWFTPTRPQLFERIRQLEDEHGTSGSYLYCSDNCKEECPLYGKRVSQLIKQDQIRAGIIKEELYTSKEYNTWRQEVFNRNGYYCEYCSEIGNHVHHSRPQKLEPGFALDPEFGIVCCRECHYKYGHKTRTECSTGKLANKIC